MADNIVQTAGRDSSNYDLKKGLTSNEKCVYNHGKPMGE